MTKSRRQPFLLQLTASVGATSDPAPIRIGPMSAAMQVKLTRAVIAKVDSARLETELIELCRQFCLELNPDFREAAVFRAITGVVHSHQRRMAEESDLTVAAIQLLPYCLSEAVIGLAVVHADWAVAAHAPALTFIPVALAARRRSHPSLVRGAGRPIAPMPTDEQLRSTPEYAYALGMMVKSLQKRLIHKEASNPEVFAVGNQSLDAFIAHYEDALHGAVDIAKFPHEVQDGGHYVDNFHRVMHYELGREAADPRLTQLLVDMDDHPAIRTGQACERALEDVDLRDRLRKQLSDALHTLSPRQLEAWYFRYVADEPDEAAAGAMRVAKSTYRTHLDRAKDDVVRHAYATTVLSIADQCADELMFLDLVSALLGPEAYRMLLTPASPVDPNDEMATIQRPRSQPKE